MTADLKPVTVASLIDSRVAKIPHYTCKAVFVVKLAFWSFRPGFCFQVQNVALPICWGATTSEKVCVIYLNKIVILTLPWQIQKWCESSWFEIVQLCSFQHIGSIISSSDPCMCVIQHDWLCPSPLASHCSTRFPSSTGELESVASSHEVCDMINIVVTSTDNGVSTGIDSNHSVPYSWVISWIIACSSCVAKFCYICIVHVVTIEASSYENLGVLIREWASLLTSHKVHLCPVYNGAVGIEDAGAGDGVVIVPVAFRIILAKTQAMGGVNCWSMA